MAAKKPTLSRTARLGVVKPALAQDQLLLRAYESHRSIQETLEKEKNRPVILLVSARVNTKRATKHDGDHVYKDRDHGKDVGPRSFAYSNCIRHKEPR